MKNTLYIDQSAVSTGYAFMGAGGKIIYGEINLKELKKNTLEDSATIRKSIPKGDIIHSQGNIKVIKETKQNGSTSINAWRESNGEWIKQKKKTDSRKYDEEERIRILYHRLNKIVKDNGIEEIVYETTGSVPKRYDPVQKKSVPVVNVATLLKLGQVEATIILVAHNNLLGRTRTIRAQEHQLFTRELLLKAGKKIHLKDKYNKRTKKTTSSHLTKLDSISFASSILKEEIKSDNISDAICMMFYDRANSN